MGMAASQARYLALVARKSNCEYEGQQINQARTALSNQSANLFNQMLGLNVPVPPSTQDFTVTQYSFKDGNNASTISSWEQLSSADPDYNYVVTHYYYTDQYTGSQKMMSDPQVQFSATPVNATQITVLRAEVASAEDELNRAKTANNLAKADYDSALKELNRVKADASNIKNYATDIEEITAASFDGTNFTVTTGAGDTDFVPYDQLADKTAANEMIAALIDIGALPANYGTDKTGLCFTEDGTSFAYQSDLSNLVVASAKPGFDNTLSTYSSANVANYQSQIDSLEAIEQLTRTTYETTLNDIDEATLEYDKAVKDYQDLAHPQYIGNCELEALASLTENQEAEIRQIVSDMDKQGITSEITNCYDITNGKYNGGIYSFKMNGVTYFTTYNDLANSYNSGTGINNIDDQIKMAYYNASYVSTKVEKTEKALLETDGAGRFTSVRFEDNTMTYTLNMETITDEKAYQDAMNQYYYENAKYDKMIQDINAKTSIIQQEDQQLELRLKQLDTEQSALSTEMEAVKKVVDDNVEKSFKTFGG